MEKIGGENGGGLRLTADVNSLGLRLTADRLRLTVLG
jgi:hypothetical protein